MIPIIIGGALTWVLYEVISSITNKEPSSFSKENIKTEYLKIFGKDQEKIAKIHATKSINKLIKIVKEFKIGKSGAPEDRNKAHILFEVMYLIVESEDKSFIDKLEGIYNEKYITINENMNIKVGSAGEMTDKKGRYFLYFIANEKKKK